MSNDRYSTNSGWAGSHGSGKYYSNMNNYNKSNHYGNGNQASGSHHAKHQNLQVGNPQSDFARGVQYHEHHNNYSVNHHVSNSYGKYYDRYNGGAPNIPYQGRGGYYSSRGGSSGRYGGKPYHYPYTQSQQQQQQPLPQQQPHQRHAQHSQQGPVSQIFSSGYVSSNTATVSQASPSLANSTNSPLQQASYKYSESGNSLYNYNSDSPVASSSVPANSNLEIVSDDDHLKSSRIWAKLLKVTTVDDPKSLESFEIPSYREATFVKKFRKDLDDLDEINKKIREYEITKVNNEFQFDNWTRIEKTTNLIYDLNNKKLEEMVNNEW